MPTNRCSVLTNSSFRRSASACAWSVTSLRRGDMPAATPPYADGSFDSSSLRAAADRRRVDVHLAQQAGDDAFALVDQRGEQVLGLDLRVVAALRELDRRGHRFARFFRVLVDVHDVVPLSSCRERFEMRALFGRQRLRQLHLHGCVEVAGFRLVRSSACRAPSGGTSGRSASSPESSAAASCRQASAPPLRRRAPRS